MHKRFDRLAPGERFTGIVPQTHTHKGAEKELTFLGVLVRGSSWLYVAADDEENRYVAYGGMWVPAPGVDAEFDHINTGTSVDASTSDTSIDAGEHDVLKEIPATVPTVDEPIRHRKRRRRL